MLVNRISLGSGINDEGTLQLEIRESDMKRLCHSRGILALELEAIALSSFRSKSRLSRARNLNFIFL